MSQKLSSFSAKILKSPFFAELARKMPQFFLQKTQNLNFMQNSLSKHANFFCTKSKIRISCRICPSPINNKGSRARYFTRRRACGANFYKMRAAFSRPATATAHRGPGRASRPLGRRLRIPPPLRRQVMRADYLIHFTCIQWLFPGLESH